MANIEYNQYSWVTSTEKQDGCNWESVFSCDDDCNSSKRRRIDHKEATSEFEQNVPQYFDLQPLELPLEPSADGSEEDVAQYFGLQPKELSLETFIFGVACKNLVEEKIDTSPSWEDFFQFMVSQNPDVVTEPDAVKGPNVSTTPRKAYNVRRESSIVVKDSKIRYFCTKCTETFSTLRGLKNHQNTHKFRSTTATRSPRISYRSEPRQQPNPIHKKEFTCPRCERGFNIKGDRLVHLVTESCVRADRYLRRVTGGWECTYCDKIFNSRDYAERHVRANHEAGRRLQCPVCKEDFTGFKGNVLVRHVINRHPEYLDDLDS